jgi:anthranilate phosphoribosyltransferase
VVGVYEASLVPRIAQVLAELGSVHALVVHGSDGLDEITVTGATTVGEVRDGEVAVYRVEPEELGVGRARLEDLRGGEPADNARAMERVFAGEAGPLADVTAVNAGAALYVGGLAAGLAEGTARARELLAAGAAAAKLAELQGRTW